MFEAPNIFEVPFTSDDVLRMDGVMQRIVDMGAELALVVDYEGRMIASADRDSPFGIGLVFGGGRFRLASNAASAQHGAIQPLRRPFVWHRRFEYVAVGIATFVQLDARVLEGLTDDVEMVFEQYRNPYGYRPPRERRRR